MTAPPLLMMSTIIIIGPCGILLFQRAVVIMGGGSTASRTVVIVGGIGTFRILTAHAGAELRLRRSGRFPIHAAVGMERIGAAHRAVMVMPRLNAARDTVVIMGRVFAVSKVAAHAGQIHRPRLGSGLRLFVGGISPHQRNRTQQRQKHIFHNSSFLSHFYIIIQNIIF